MSTIAPAKKQNVTALWGLLALDGLFLFFGLNNFEIPAHLPLQALAVRGLVSVAAPGIALLLGGAVPATAKDALVFWRLWAILPGHRAFSHFAKRDPRIDFAKLERNVAVAFPEDPQKQNALWYRLYKKVESDPAIDQCNRSFLLLREIAAISALATIMSCVWWCASVGTSREIAITAAILFAVQYALSAVGSANFGRRLVTTVLAAHSVKRRA